MASLILAFLGVVLSWQLGGVPGIFYLVYFAALCAPGLPLGFALFGRGHAAGWIAGGLIGYALSAITLRLPIDLGHPSVPAFMAVWITLTVVMWFALRTRGPWLTLPPWTRGDSRALMLTLLIVPLLVWRPFTQVGASDESGSHRYRAYFTADFLWHVALTSELARFETVPRNPYLVRRPLNYYWAYFVPPSLAAAAAPARVESILLINAFCAGILLIAALFIAAWTVVPRAGPVATAVVLAVSAASAEGWHAIARLVGRGQSLWGLRQLNIDAITSWFLQGLTVDGLPRSLWYTPQHATACALALVALMVPPYAVPNRPLIGLAAGVPLGLSIIFSPFLGGAFCLIYGATSVWYALRKRNVIGFLWTTAPAAIPALAGLGWCLLQRTFEGAGGVIAVGLSRRASEAPEAVLLTLGPVLVPGVAGLVLARRGRYPLAAAAFALFAGLFAFHFVTLTSEPIWIGWRAGQIMLTTLPALIAAALAMLWDGGRRRLAVSVAVVALIAGLPTTLIDAYNAQDVSNTDMGPGFRWTVVVSPDTREVLTHIRDHTPREAVVQMSIGPRGRETWTNVPTFAQRRMAAGRPISLLNTPEYDELSNLSDEIFRTADAARAGELARELRIDFVFVDDVERQAFGHAAVAKFEGSPYFTRVFSSGGAAVYAVR